MAAGVFVEGQSVKFALNPDTLEVAVDVEMPEEGPTSVKDYALYINTITPVTPEETRFQAFGDIGDPEEAHLVIQAAIQAGVEEKRPVRFDNREYLIRRPIDWVSQMILEAKGEDTRIRNTLTQAEATALGVNVVNCCAFNPGNGHPRFLGAAAGGGFGTAHATIPLFMTWIPIAAAQAGQTYVTSTTPADLLGAGAPLVGDIVYVRDAKWFNQYYADGTGAMVTNELPHSAPLNLVKSIDLATGVIQLDDDVARGFTSGYIGLAHHPIDPATGVAALHDAFLTPITAVYGCRSEGVGWAADDYYPAAYGSTYRCELYGKLEGLNPASFNGWHRGKANIQVVGTKKLGELAMCSSRNTFDWHGSHDHNHADVSHANLFGECNFGNEVNIYANYRGVTGTPAHSLAYLAICEQNTYRFFGKATGKWFAPVTVYGADTNADGHDPYQSQPLTAGNTADFSQLDVSEAVFYYDAYFTNQTGAVQGDGEASNRDNTVIVEAHHATAPSVSPVNFAGYRNIVRGHIGNGTLTVGTTGHKDCVLDTRGGMSLGNISAGGYKYLKSIRHDGIDHPAGLKQDSTSSTSWAPDFSYPNQELTFTGASIQIDAPTNQNANRRVRMVLINGTAGNIRPTFNSAYFKLTTPQPLYPNAVAATQATSKSTAVTLNGLFGIITMNAANLAAGTSVQFTLNNNLLFYPDTLLVTMQGGTTNFSSYGIDVACGASGSAVIIVHNKGLVDLTDALILQFRVIRTGLPMLAPGAKLVVELEKASDGSAQWISSRPIVPLQ